MKMEVTGKYVNVFEILEENKNSKMIIRKAIIMNSN